MSYQPKGSMQRINSIEHIPSTSPNRNRYAGGRVILKLECGHEVNRRKSALARKNGAAKPKKAMCWKCADNEKNENVCNHDL